MGTYFTDIATTDPVVAATFNDVLDELDSAISDLNEASAFSATLSGDQTIPTATATKLQFNTETFDINSDYDAVINYRHTPTIAGKYLYVLQARLDDDADGQYFRLDIEKNGAQYATVLDYGTGGGTMTNVVVTILDMNGSTDYVEAYCLHNTGGDEDITSNDILTRFSGSLLHRS